MADEKLILSQPLELMSLNLQQGDDSLLVTISKALPLFRMKGAGLRTSCSLTCVHASRTLFWCWYDIESAHLSHIVYGCP